MGEKSSGEGERGDRVVDDGHTRVQAEGFGEKKMEEGGESSSAASHAGLGDSQRGHHAPASRQLE